MIPIENSYSFPSIPGIYKFTNKTNGKVYIGESLYMKDRMSKYRASIKRPACVIDRALAKYSFDGFYLEVVESFPIGTPKSVLLGREKFWIWFYNSTDTDLGYNRVAFGKDMTGYKMSQEAKNKISKANKGRKFSDESKKRMSEGQMGKKVSNIHQIGRPLKEETKRKISEATSGKPKLFNRRKILQICPITLDIIKEWDSLTSACVESGLFKNKKQGIDSISRVLEGGRKSSRGFKWEYAEPSKRQPKPES